MFHNFNDKTRIGMKERSEQLKSNISVPVFSFLAGQKDSMDLQFGTFPNITDQKGYYSQLNS